jgi:hypothetical protein
MSALTDVWPLAAFALLLYDESWATLVFRPSTGRHYITPAAIQIHIEKGASTRETKSNEAECFKFSFNHNYFSYKKLVIKPGKKKSVH